MDPIPKDVLFILDISGSMFGKKIKQQREAMDKILQDLHEGDNFNIMQFSSNAILWQQSLVPANNENKQRARAYSQTMSANGGELLLVLLTGSFLNASIIHVSRRINTLCIKVKIKTHRYLQQRCLPSVRISIILIYGKHQHTCNHIISLREETLAHKLA